MKKAFLIILCMLCALSLAACSKKAEPAPTPDVTSIVIADPAENPADAGGTLGVPNPMVQVNVEELNNRSGLSFVVPINAEEVYCCYIATEPEVYEMSFKLDGKDFTVRAAKTDAMDESIAGLYYDWSVVGDGATDRGDPIAYYKTADGNEGAYYVYTNGTTWCVYMSGGADVETMAKVLKNFAPSF